MVSRVKDPVGGVVVGLGATEISLLLGAGRGEARASLAGDTRVLGVLLAVRSHPPSPPTGCLWGDLVSAAGTTPCL